MRRLEQAGELDGILYLASDASGYTKRPDQLRGRRLGSGISKREWFRCSIA
ncbi:hypothetical protein [Desulforamulus putei]|uniref:hypothetical protein n=1 Tax=Desulforamulus putei TaxID=74701 RepID=UPI002FDD5171